MEQKLYRLESMVWFINSRLTILFRKDILIMKLKRAVSHRPKSGVSKLFSYLRLVQSRLNTPAIGRGVSRKSASPRAFWGNLL